MRKVICWIVARDSVRRVMNVADMKRFESIPGWIACRLSRALAWLPTNHKPKSIDDSFCQAWLSVCRPKLVLNGKCLSQAKAGDTVAGIPVFHDLTPVTSKRSSITG